MTHIFNVPGRRPDVKASVGVTISDRAQPTELAVEPLPGSARRAPDGPQTPTVREGRSAHHLCPVWVGYLLASPLRRLVENPETWLAPHVRPGMTALDLGCPMGFFSLRLARMVGPSSRVVCVNLQEAMLRRLHGRVRRAGLDGVVETRCCTGQSLGLEDVHGQADLALALHVVHEVTDPRRFLAETFAALRPGGTLLLAEPSGHVTEVDRAATFELAERVGFRRTGELAPSARSRPVAFSKPLEAR